MTRRPLKPEEKQVWDRVARTVRPRRAKSAKPVPIPGRDEFAAMLRLPPAGPENKKDATHRLEKNNDRKTRRGRLEIDVSIDLHDLTQGPARSALIRSIMRAAKHNQKTILVITGKGVRLNGVLRRNFVDWLHAPEIRPFIAGYAPAHIRHGGNGAWYVFLKR